MSDQTAVVVACVAGNAAIAITFIICQFLVRRDERKDHRS